MLREKKLLGRFMKKNCNRQNKKNLGQKRKGNKLHVKWKGYDNSFNSWIDKLLFTTLSFWSKHNATDTQIG